MIWTNHSTYKWTKAFLSCSVPQTKFNPSSIKFSGFEKKNEISLNPKNQIKKYFDIWLLRS
jgi:hypothetical protein